MQSKYLSQGFQHNINNSQDITTIGMNGNAKKKMNRLKIRDQLRERALRRIFKRRDKRFLLAIVGEAPVEVFSRDAEKFLVFLFEPTYPWLHVREQRSHPRVGACAEEEAGDAPSWHADRGTLREVGKADHDPVLD